ncbi:Formate dehydrogenase-O, major subunit [Candidatus Filomicrobium marinum]|uniref:Formate dehydrogenase-O, major subunit n=1 Tax=Candidatus Filomicrobium marinum TaxID=1608628 RepID=A0A0D6JJF6_9HYPH|nr:formate dehydrogenase subunit alpha [Candidatus Filomicrobium marinum]CFX35811.1 Formate dehydrogenase-O, major subunit [Candidatus Filomicrobium marinum]CPR21785.1 Formate dehydrogenase-O, major subunit [Candidatus Filomicrobium marinum]
MLKKKRSGEAGTAVLSDFARTSGMSRRHFLEASGFASAAFVGAATLKTRRVRAQPRPAPTSPTDIQFKKTICPFCAVGCSIWAEVQNGVWIGQEPAFESPINLGTHCAKGAATRELAIGDRRLKYPMKLEGGKWKRIPWDVAIDEVGDKILKVRDAKGPDSVYWLGSAKFSNEMAYLHRKFAAFWGTNNTDHQARICHSTTVAGVANTYGYGAMTNTFNDMHNSKSIFLLGANPAEAHPVAMQHVLRARENGCKFIVVDPRFTRTAAHADEYVRLRPGSDVAFMWGVLWYILANGWEDKDYINQRVFRFEDVRKEVKNYPPDVVANITGVPPVQIERVAKLISENRPGALIWCMGLTQSTIGNNKVRAASIIQLALGNIGKPGGGANIFRGHDNVQGATDLGVTCDSLPAYYGLSEGAWKHWARVWGVDYEWLKGRFASKDLMERKGMPVSRWFDGVLEDAKNIDQPNTIGAMIYWGHAPNSQTRGPDLKKGMEKLDLLVIIDPVPTSSAVIGDRQDGVYLLPAGSTMEMSGSVTNSNRSLQWREQVIAPMFEAKSDYEIAYLLAQKFGFADKMFNQVEVKDNAPVAEDLLRELTRGCWTIGYTGQSPERLKVHMANQSLFDPTTLLGMSGPVKGEYYGLPWPCWGTPEMKHPGTPLLYDLTKTVAQGGLPFRAAWGVEHEGVNLLAENSYPEGSPIKDGYPEITVAVLDKLGFVDQLTPRENFIIAAIALGDYHPRLLKITDDEAAQLMKEGGGGAAMPPSANDAEGAAKAQQLGLRAFAPNARAAIEGYLAHHPNKTNGASKQGDGGSQSSSGETAARDQGMVEPDTDVIEKILKINWKTDLSGGVQRVAVANGLAPFGNGKARALVWNFPDGIPVHREPLYTVRRDLLPRYKTYEDRKDFRLPTLYWSIQKNDVSKDFPMILTSGRLVEFEGGGDETRANIWLAEFQQRMFAEINPEDATALGIQDGSMIWIATPEKARVRVTAQVTKRIGKGAVFMPFHFAGMWQGEDRSDRYPEGTVPYVIGEAANTATTYGYDVVTFMQETKATICRVEKA